MKGLVYDGPGKKKWEDVPKPKLKMATDALVRMTKTTICGTDGYETFGNAGRERGLKIILTGK